MNSQRAVHTGDGVILRLTIPGRGNVPVFLADKDFPAVEHMDVFQAIPAGFRSRGGRVCVPVAKQHRAAAEPAVCNALLYLADDPKQPLGFLKLFDLRSVRLPVAPFSNHILGGNIDDLGK